MGDLGAGRQRVERTLVAPADELGAGLRLDELLGRAGAGGDPVTVGAPAVRDVGLHRGGDVGRQGPRRRGPDDEGLPGPVEQREADVEGRVLLVDVAARQLVGRDRRAAPRAPLRRPVALEDPAPLVDDLEELPDVLDVGVGERVVVVPPVHPLPEADRAGRQLGGRLLDDGAALRGERGEAVLLDLPLGVQPELLLDADLDPQALAVEAVLVALVVAVERLVAQEDVLQGPTPGGVHGQRLVRRDRTVDEAELRTVRVLRPQLVERALTRPEVEDRQLERVVVGLGGQRTEHRAAILRAGSRCDQVPLDEDGWGARCRRRPGHWVGRRAVPVRRDRRRRRRRHGRVEADATAPKASRANRRSWSSPHRPCRWRC